MVSLQALANLPSNLKQYLLVTFNYWAFTLTDGALRMLVVLYFHQLGYAPLAITMLFLFYEIFGVITNLIGGWLGARIGLNKTMQIGLVLQVFALLMLALPSEYLSVIWVMFAQALSGIAKDLNKMSAKSSIKTLVPSDQQGAMFKWVALLTGSKNTLKGVGFFLGGFLLTTVGFQQGVVLMAMVLAVIALMSQFLLKKEIGKAKNKPKFTRIFSTHAPLNYLSAARLFLFGARDIWFVIAAPVFLASQLQWSHQNVGIFMACWVIGYGIIQAATPKYISLCGQTTVTKTAKWALWLSVVSVAIALGMYFSQGSHSTLELILTSGLLAFGAVFAVNSALHSYIIVSIAKEDGVSMDVGFYYMANALGRLIGTILSGVIYQEYGIEACLIGATIMALCSSWFINQVTLPHASLDNAQV